LVSVVFTEKAEILLAKLWTVRQSENLWYWWLYRSCCRWPAQKNGIFWLDWPTFTKKLRQKSGLLGLLCDNAHGGVGQDNRVTA